MTDGDDDERKIRDRLTRLYARLPVENAPECARVAIGAIHSFFKDVSRWSIDMPRPHPNQVGKGRPQTQPSQQRIHVIAELEQIAAFMNVVAARGTGGQVSIKPLKGRRRISRHAIRALLGTGLIGSARLSSWADGDLSQDSRPWNVRVGGADIRQMKRALAEAARDRRPVILSIRSGPRTLRRRHRQLLLLLSHDLSRHVEIDVLRRAVGPRAASALKQRAQTAAQDLRGMLNLHDNMRSKGRNRPLAAYTDPVPIYALARRLLEAGWPPKSDFAEPFSNIVRQMSLTRISPDIEDIADEIENACPLNRDVAEHAIPRDRQRLLAAGDIKSVFLEIGREVIEHLISVVEQRPMSEGHDIFIGTDPTEIIAGLREGRSSEDWPTVIPIVMQRICLRVLELREQVIILRDHAAALNLWTEAVGKRVWPHYSRNLETLETEAFYPLLDWARECEAQYSELSLYTFDRGRRLGGETGLRSDLPAGFLYEPYIVRQSAYGVYYALTTPERMRLLLARMPGDRESKGRATAALGELAALIPDHLWS